MGSDRLTILREDLEQVVAPIEAYLGDRLACARGCSACCVDGLTVFSVEADPIRAYVREHMVGERPHPPGACPFLSDEGTCRVYPVRPYVCRTQGLPLRWAVDEGEARDTCHLHEHRFDVLSLGPEHCFELGPFEGRLAQLERERRGRWPEAEDRVSLRDLFEAE